MKITKLISKFDLFSANATLRASGESEVGNFCGGFFSILIFAAFLTVFAISLNNTVSLQKISTTEMSEVIKLLFR